MPRIRRWFHVSHDINSDPEVWELTDRFGERAYRVWIEILSIADRYAGMVPGDDKYLCSTLAAKNKVRSMTVSHVLKYAKDKTWLVYDPHRRVRNHLKYRPSRETKEIPERKQLRSPPHTPHNTTHTKTPKGVLSSRPELTPVELIESWNEICGTEGLPKVTEFTNGRQAQARKRLKTYRTVEFWGRVFNGIIDSDYLMGRKRKEGDTWKPDFDWVVRNDENPAKVVEGKYGQAD